MAAIAPTNICPSAPMFQMSMVNDSMTAIPVIVRGIAFTTVSLRPYASPRDAVRIALYA